LLAQETDEKLSEEEKILGNLEAYRLVHKEIENG
jgi:hypothetical protein